LEEWPPVVEVCLDSGDGMASHHGEALFGTFAGDTSLVLT
jgi:hypothetical protein